MQEVDYIVVGSGVAGAILAERLASQLDQKILIIEKRSHIGGNMYDYEDENKILVHKYGPHLFRTNEDRIIEYLTQFTDWHPYEHKVVANVDNKLIPVPFNFKSIEILFSQEKANLYKDKLLKFFGKEAKVPLLRLRLHEDQDIKELGEIVFNKIYLNYTIKQWGDTPENLDFDAISSRVPIHVSYEARYKEQKFQALPADGYTKMFERMLASPNIRIELNTNSKEAIKLDLEKLKIYFKGEEFKGNLIYTGPVDELFDYRFGELPYRSLRFMPESCNMPCFQPNAQVNYPNSEDYTRITEFNYMMRTPNKSKTTIMYEYPQDYDKDDPTKNIPYYPIPKDSNTMLYEKYRSLALTFKHLYLIGRLAEYKYYDMDDVISKALDMFDSIRQNHIKQRQLTSA